MEQPYWDKEFPDVRVIGRARVAHYKKAGVLQFSLLTHDQDGSLKISRTICLYRKGVNRDNFRNLDFIMNILSTWRKETRAEYPIDQQINKKETIVLPDKEALENAAEVEQGDFIYDGLMAESVRVDTLTDKVMNTDAEAMGADASDAKAKYVRKVKNKHVKLSKKSKKMVG